MYKIKKIVNKSFLIVVLGLLAALSTLTIAMYIPGFHQIANDFQVKESQIAFTLTSYFIGITIGQLVYGPIIDRFGRKIPLLISLILYILTTALCSISDSLDMMISVRFLQAFGASAGMVSALAIIMDVFEPQHRAKAFSLVMTVLGVAPIVSPSLGSFFVAAYNWESVFYALTGYGVLIFFLVFFFLPETILYKSQDKLSGKLILNNYGKVVMNKTFSLYAIGGSFANSVIFAFVAASPAIFMGYYGVAPKQFGLLYGISTTGALAGNYLNGVLVKKIHFKKMMVIGSVLLFVLTAGFTVVAYWVNHLPFEWVVVALFFILLSVGLIYPNTVTSALAPFKELSGSASAINGSFMMGMSAFITAVVGVLGRPTPFTISSIMMAASVLVIVFVQLGKLYEK
ncbi:MAG: multidrug effflux MFS transporter [Ignavibacteriota bacterium]|nr:multidrug effflux MFS transporter [Ignavibacterium sp.]MCO6446570.1 multidrug effflux MFS transporter [Ignavibacterium album]MCZ2268679.1 multidrug effflux MFS transporter [Ignavibacteriales bacterium]QKK00594.1 MAG: multidrug effflux MFS transporter [Ignavibacteriota bacterium]HOJ08184.1 multidrug effflux MFS transporter [Ignavibacteriaceae bacterium]